MALVVKGRIVPISNDPTVAPDDQASFAGRVWIGDDGRIAAVTRGRAVGPPALAGAPVVDVGSRLVVPGLIDLHNHLAYDTLPIWAEPTRGTPWAHRATGRGAPTACRGWVPPRSAGCRRRGGCAGRSVRGRPGATRRRPPVHPPARADPR